MAPFMSSIRRRPHALAAVVALLGLVLTGGGALVVDSAQDERDRITLAARTREVADAISGRLDAYIALLQGGRGLFATERVVSIAEFDAYARALDLRRRYPGLQGFGLSRRLARHQLADTLAEMAAAGTPATLRDIRPRDEYHVIVALEPPDARNRAALGYDMFQEPSRRLAMERARDTGEPAATGRVTLVQEIDGNQQPGFLLYMPVYAGGEPPRDVAARTERLAGFVYAPFRAHELLSALVGYQRGVQLRVYDGPELVRENLLFEQGEPDSEAQASDMARESIHVAGRTWTIVLQPGRDWRSRRTSALVLCAGLLVTGFLVAITTLQARARERAERLLADLARSEAELRAHEEQLRQAVTDAQEASRLKDEFLATVSHELRTPLQSILGWTSLLRTGDLDAARVRRAVDTIDRNARSQAQIVEDVLDLSRIVSGRLKLESTAVDLSAVLEAAVEVVRPAAEAKGVVLEVLVEPALVARGDAGRLQQVFWNLLSNAVKFTPAGGRVETIARGEGRLVQVDIRDSGQGISPEFLPHVFDAFRQQDQSRTRRFGGLGLGLSIVRQLVEMHGGTVTASSSGAGQGSTFRVELPTAVLEGGALHVGPVADDATLPRLDDVRVLVVDDHPDGREAVEAILTQSGALVETAESAAVAWPRLLAAPPDVLVCDIAMPEEDGLSFIRRVRALPAGGGARVPAIALTAYARVEEHTRSLEAGFDRHLAKPVEATELVAAVRQLAGARHDVAPPAG
jgi:signal transduction histidine kinase/ActR/RegA family two-component response regulator